MNSRQVLCWDGCTLELDQIHLSFFLSFFFRIPSAFSVSVYVRECWLKTNACFAVGKGKKGGKGRHCWLIESPIHIFRQSLIVDQRVSCVDHDDFLPTRCFL